MVECHAWKNEPRLTKDGRSCAGDSHPADFGVRLDKPADKQKSVGDGPPTATRANEPKPEPKPEPTLPIIVVLPDGTIIRQEKPGPVDYDKK